MAAVNMEDLRKCDGGESSSAIRNRVIEAWNIQKERFEGTDYRFNADIRSQDIEKYCVLEPEAEVTLQKLFRKMGLSARAYYRLLKVSRTIADLEQRANIAEKHIKEAACYRMNFAKITEGI
jgi:magnesium chelatase family protein